MEKDKLRIVSHGYFEDGASPQVKQEVLPTSFKVITHVVPGRGSFKTDVVDVAFGNICGLPQTTEFPKQCPVISVALIRDQQASIHVENGDSRDIVGDIAKILSREENSSPKDVIKNWFRKDTNIFLANKAIFSKITERYMDYKLHLIMDTVNDRDIFSILTSTYFIWWEHLVTRSSLGRRSSEGLSVIMDAATSKRSLRIEGDVDLNFSHCQAFKFQSMDYEDARWVNINQLQFIRGVKSLRLRKTLLTCSDMNKFVVNLVRDGSEMCKYSEINLNPAADFNMPQLLKNLVTLQSHKLKM